MTQATYNKIIQELKEKKPLEKIKIDQSQRKELLNYTSAYGYTENYQVNVCQNINHLKTRSVVKEANIVAKQALAKNADNTHRAFNNQMASLIIEDIAKLERFEQTNCVN
jgi:hypothetical protein